MIRLLEEEDTSKIMRIFRDATSLMDEREVPQWDEVYPSREVIAQDLKARTLYGFFVEEKLAGVLVLNTVQAKEYQTINWGLDDPRPLVLHRLCLSPEFQGKGYSKLMMNFVEDFAAKYGYQSIRFDAFTKNLVSVGLYRKLGYQERGTARFRKGDFFCFEKVLV